MYGAFDPNLYPVCAVMLGGTLPTPSFFLIFSFPFFFSGLDWNGGHVFVSSRSSLADSAQ